MRNAIKIKFAFNKFIRKQPFIIYFCIAIGIVLALVSQDYLSDKGNRVYKTLSADSALTNSTELRPTDCENKPSEPSKIQCWDDLTALTLKKEGIESAFKLLAKLYKSDPSFPEKCHDIAHRIGKTAYMLFSQGKKFRLTEETTWCGYGFYHSFVEDMMTAGENLKKAGQFCDSAGKQLKKESPELTQRCYHGIGHGAVNIHDPRLWGNDRALIEPAVKICKLAVTSEDQLGACASGIFNAVEIAYKVGEILKLNKADPFWICREQEGTFKTNCYGYLSTAILRVNNYDFAKAVKFVEGIKEDSIVNYSMKILGVTIAYLNIKKTDHSEFVKTCNSLQKRLIFPCLDGYVTGLMHIGEPGKEYLVGFNFCRTRGMSEDEQKNCFKTVLDESASLYSLDEYKGICAGVEDKYRGLCEK